MWERLHPAPGDECRCHLTAAFQDEILSTQVRRHVWPGQSHGPRVRHDQTLTPTQFKHCPHAISSSSTRNTVFQPRKYSPAYEYGVANLPR